MTDALYPVGVMENEVLTNYYSQVKTEEDLIENIVNQKNILYTNFFWLIIYASNDKSWTKKNQILAGRVYELVRTKISDVEKKLISVEKDLDRIEKIAENIAGVEHERSLSQVISESKRLKRYDQYEELKESSSKELPQFFKEKAPTSMLYDFMRVIAKKSRCISNNANGINPFTVGALKQITDDALDKHKNLIHSVKQAAKLLIRPQTNPKSDLDLFFDLVAGALHNKEYDFLFLLLSKLEIPYTLAQKILLWDGCVSGLLEELRKAAPSYKKTLEVHRNKLGKMSKQFPKDTATVKTNTSMTLEIDSNVKNSLRQMYANYENNDYYLWDKLVDHVSSLRFQNRWAKLLKQLAALPIDSKFKLFFVSSEFDTHTLENLQLNNNLSSPLKGEFDNLRKEMPITDKFHLYEACNRLFQGSPSSSYSSSPPSSAPIVLVDKIN